MTTFNYDRAFYRNIGWFTTAEQKTLVTKTVAIAGLGGAGGVHLLTMVRLGIQNFHIAEFDHFELSNFNRQVGATISNLGRSKLEVIAGMAKDINPDCTFKIFPEGVNKENVGEFLKDADVYLDGIDFFCLPARRIIFNKCHELGIPGITAAPVAMGTSYMVFMPGKMSFEEYFGFEGRPELEQYARFMAGISPLAVHRHYLVDESKVNIAGKEGPSTMIACNLCAGVTAAEAIKILLKRGEVYAAPYYHLFDAYLNKHKVGYVPFGKRNPLFLAKTFFINRHITDIIKHNSGDKKIYTRPVEKILDRARWAPSGDNTQLWRFKIIDDCAADIITVTTYDSLYESGKHHNPIFTSLGILLETAAIAASELGYRVEFEHMGIDGHHYSVRMRCVEDSSIKPDNLAPYIEARSVNRYPYRNIPLTEKEKQALAESIGDELEIEWYETLKEKWQVSDLNASALAIHINAPEEYPVIKKRLDWKNNFSPDGMPVKSMPFDPVMRFSLRMAIKKEQVIRFTSRYMGGTFSTQLEMAIIPGMRSGGHFIMLAKDPNFINTDIEGAIKYGRKIQRFWLTVTSLGLVMQPSYASVFFSACGRSGDNFSKDPLMVKMASKVARKFSVLRKGKALPDDSIIFAGRLGRACNPVIKYRSVRKPLEELCITE